MFSGCEPHECILGPDYGKRRPLRIPVFFIGKPGQSYSALQRDIERLELGPSWPLRRFMDFSRVRFTLSAGPGYLEDYRPFFQCGFPGIVICARKCPDPLGPTRRRIIDFALSGKVFNPPPPEEAETQRREGEGQRDTRTPPSRPPAEPDPTREATPPATTIPPVAQPETTAPPTPPRPPAGASTAVDPSSITVRIYSRDALAAGRVPAGLSNLEVLAQVSCELPAQPAFTALTEGEGRVPFNRAEGERARRVCLIIRRDTPLGRSCAVVLYSAAETSAAIEDFSETQCSGRQKLAMTATTSSGAAIPPETILAAEGKLALDNTSFAVDGGELAANLSLAAFKAAVAENGMASAFAQHRLVQQRFENGKLRLILEPLYVRLGDVTIRVVDAKGAPFGGCTLRLNIDAGRRLGTGWEREANGEGIAVAQSGRIYRVSSGGTLLVSTKTDGRAGTLTSTGAACPLAGSIEVTAAELWTMSVTRTVRPLGPLLLAIVSPDDRLGSLAPRDSIDGFWAAALGFIESASTKGFDTKILGVSQSPGASTTTKIWQRADAGSGLTLTDENRANWIKTLGERSRTPDLPTKQFRAVERAQLRQMLDVVRTLSAIRSTQSAGQEHVIFISGEVQRGDSDLCRQSARGQMSNGIPWGEQVRRTIAIELWSDDAVERMDDAAETVAEVPQLYHCRLAGTLAEQVRIFAIKVPAALDAGARDAIFAHIAREAEQFFAP